MKKIEYQPFPQESRLNLKKRKSKDDLVMTKKTEKKEYQPSSPKRFGGT